MCPEGKPKTKGGQDPRWGVTFRPVVWFCIISREMKTEFKEGRAKKGTQRFREGRKNRLRRREMEEKSEKIIAAVKGL